MTLVYLIRRKVKLKFYTDHHVLGLFKLQTWFDLLKKADSPPAEIKRIKEVAVTLLETLKAEKLRIDHWRDKEATRDAVQLAIHDFLWSDTTGLPVDSYTDDDVEEKTDDIYGHVFRVYPTVPSPYYAATGTV